MSTHNTQRELADELNLNEDYEIEQDQHGVLAVGQYTNEWPDYYALRANQSATRTMLYHPENATDAWLYVTNNIVEDIQEVR